MVDQAERISSAAAIYRHQGDAESARRLEAVLSRLDAGRPVLLADLQAADALADAVLLLYEGPRLGLATTRQLLEEVAARGRTEQHYRQLGADMEMGAMNLIGLLPGSMLDYRTVPA